jgi:thiamine biosynthesis protein ThiS
MEITINGKSAEISSTTVAGLLSQLRIDPTRVVVERNLEIVSGRMQESMILCNGDRIEIVHFVGGG